MKTVPNTPEQAHVIRLMMDRIKRSQKSDHRTKAMFPEFEPGWTTAFYVSVFEDTLRRNNHERPNINMHALGSRLAPYPESVDAIDESGQLEVTQ